MKKTLCLLIAIMMLLSVAVSADVAEIAVAEDDNCYNVYVEGEGASPNKIVTFLLVDNEGKFGYVEELLTDDEGKYGIKFKFNNDINKYSVKVCEDLIATDITSTVKTAFAKKELYDLSVKISLNGNDVIGVIEEESKVDVVVEMHNKYGNETNVSVLLAAYDKDNRLLSTQKEKVLVGYDDYSAFKNVEFKDVYAPIGTAKIKAFAWEDTVNLLPLANEDVAFYGESRPFVNENEDPDDDWIVGLMGDSITHMGNYNEFLYQYYATRYPGSNVKIINRGISGSKSVHQMYRLESEVFDPNDPFYGECDEIMLMIGMNDMGAWAGKWPHGKLKEDQYLEMYPELQSEVDACVNNVEEVVVTCLEKGKKITLVTPSLHDEHESFATVFGTDYGLSLIAEGYKKLGEKYNIPVLDIYKASHMYSGKIRAEHPDATTVITETDSTHPDILGGYLLGYLFARAQETNDTVASVTIDASSNYSFAENAEISDLNVSTSSVSYTYSPKALPLYAEAPGYVYVKDFGIDITNTMNKEMIKVSNLDEGVYSVKMDGVEVGQFSADELSSGVNIAELENNPGQLQSKTVYDIAAQLRSYESTHRAIKFVEQQVVNYSTTPTSKYYEASIKNGTDYLNYTDEDWYDAVLNIRKIYESNTPQAQWSNAEPVQWIVLYLYGLEWRPEYPEGSKKAEDVIVSSIKNCHNELAQACIPVSHSVEINIVQ